MSNINSLYQISSEFKEMMDFLCEEGGELDEHRDEKMAQIEEAILSKADSIFEWVRIQRDTMWATDKRIKELKEFRDKLDRGLTRLDQYVYGCMEMMGKDRLDGNFTAIIRRKPVEVVQIDDPDQIPFEYLHIPEPVATIKKDEIKRILKMGGDVPGASLVKSKTISIKYDMK